MSDQKCSKCEQLMGWRECYNCGGAGYTEEQEDDGSSDTYDLACNVCHGEGGWHQCMTCNPWEDDFA